MRQWNVNFYMFNWIIQEKPAQLWDIGFINQNASNFIRFTQNQLKQMHNNKFGVRENDCVYD